MLSPVDSDIDALSDVSQACAAAAAGGNKTPTNIAKPTAANRDTARIIVGSPFAITCVDSELGAILDRWC